MDDDRRAFLETLLNAPSPSGFESEGQSAWIDYVEPFADEVRTDAYGNVVAVREGDADASLAVAGHGDEIGLIVRDVTDDGFVRIDRVGGSDKTVTRGQHVTVHTADGPVNGVVGQTAIHMRDADDDTVPDIDEQHVDVGASDGEAAEELVDRGDPVTIDQRISELDGSKIAAKALDNRIGIWAAAETLRLAAKRDVDATVYAVATVQEELGLKGAQMVGFDLPADGVVAVDVTHAPDDPGAPANRSSSVALGEGPVVARGSTNHPALVETVRETADDADVDVQLQAAGSRTGTDADAFYVTGGGIPALNMGLPNRYMHTPVETIDLTDLEAIPDLLARVAQATTNAAPFEATF